LMQVAVFHTQGAHRASLAEGDEQTISFTAPYDRVFAPVGSVPLVASATSGLAISFSSATPGVCSVAGSMALASDLTDLPQRENAGECPPSIVDTMDGAAHRMKRLWTDEQNRLF
jgi:hypothetical protein